MKKIFIVYGHYNDQSFNAAIRDTFVNTAKEKGHLVDVVDLYKEKFIKNSIEKIKCSVDDEFDPTFHEALEVSKSDQIDKDKIINIIQDGYLIKDKLFRPTLVTVSSGKGDSDE